MRPHLARVLVSTVAASLIAAPAIPALAGESRAPTPNISGLTAAAFEELGAPGSLVAALHTDDPQRLYPYVRPVGDLDGDGGDDVVTFTRDGDTPSEVLTATARKGTDGSVLFTKDLGTDGVVTLLESGPVGMGGADGLLLGIYNFEAMVYGSSTGTGFTMGPYGERPFSYSSTGVNVSLTVMALASDGSVLWKRSFTDGRYAYTGLTLAVVQHLPILTGSLQAVPGAPKDVTIALYDRTPTANNSQDDAVQLQTLDGRNGQTVSTRSIDIDNTEAPIAVAPDLDGDGLDDLTLRLLPAAGTTPVSTPTLIGLRGSDGTELWRNGTLPLDREVPPVPAGDLNGDGRGDLLLTDANLRTSSSSTAQSVTFVDGKTGASFLTSDADTARPLGDIDGDGSAEVLLSSAFYTSNSVEVVHEVVHRTGAFVWEKSFELQGFNDPHASLLPSPGDVDGDGVADFAHHMGVYTSSGTDLTGETRFLSGRTGQTIRTGGPYGFALGESLDGNGDDIALVTPFGASVIDVSGADGRTGQPRFTTRLRPRGDETRSSQVDGADVNADGIVDLVVNTEGLLHEEPEIPEASSADPAYVWDGFVINGKNGALLWSTDAPKIPAQPDLKGAVASGASFSWNGTVGSGSYTQTSTDTGICNADDPTNKCETVLLEFANAPAGGAASATRAATISLDGFAPVGEPNSDFDMYVYESDELGTLGTLVDQSDSAGSTPPDAPIGEKVTLQVTTTTQQPSHYYLVQVVYYRSVQSGYHGSASLA